MISTSLFVLVGVVNLLPVTGVLSAARLRALYGVAPEDTDLLILMRHRAVLLGTVGGLLVAAAFHGPLRPAALIAGLVSMLSFVVVARVVGGYNRELARVAGVDLVASALLLAAGVLDWLD